MIIIIYVCIVSRPCKRCVALGKVETCIDIKHKKRGRPKLKDKKPHPYNTHATADAKTWGVSNTQFLPPTTTNPTQSSGHHHHHHHHPHHSLDQQQQHQQQQSSHPHPHSHPSTQHQPHHHSQHQPHHNNQSQHAFTTFIPSPPHYNSPPPSRCQQIPIHYQSFMTKSPKFIDQQIVTATAATNMMNSSSPTSSLPASASRFSTDNQPTIAMLLTIDRMTCANVSDECLGILGYYPMELIHKSLYDYVIPGDEQKLQKLVSTLLDKAQRYNQFNQPSPSPQSSSLPLSLVTSEDPRFARNLEHLYYPARGSSENEVSDMINLKQRIGQYDLYNVRMYLGGGLGADLAQKETWSELYIVAHFTRVKVGSACMTNACISSTTTKSRMFNETNGMNGINGMNGNNNNNHHNHNHNNNNSYNGFSNNSNNSLSTIDPSLLTMSHSNVGVGRSGLLSPTLSPKHCGLPELIIPPPNPQNPSDFYSIRSPPLQTPTSSSFTPIISRPNPINPQNPSNVHRPEPIINRSVTPSSLLIDSRRSSAFSPTTRSPTSNGTISPLYQDLFDDTKSNLDPYVQYPQRQPPQQFNNEGDENTRKPGIYGSNNNGHHPEAAAADSNSTTIMSVNSLLC